MHFFIRLLALLLLLPIGAPALAGPVQANVRICGISEPYFRYGEPAPGLHGNSDTGLRNAFFHIEGLRGVEKCVNDPLLPQNQAISDLHSLIEVPGSRLCLRGNLETRHGKKKGDPDQYYFWPNSFEHLNAQKSYLLPSQLPGYYTGIASSSRVGPYKDEIAVDVRVEAIPDVEAGLRFRIPELSRILNAYFKANDNVECPLLEQATFIVSRITPKELIAKRDVYCNTSDSQHKVGLLISFTPQAIQLRAEKQPENFHIFLSLRVDDNLGTR